MRVVPVQMYDLVFLRIDSRAIHHVDSCPVDLANVLTYSPLSY